MYKTDSFHIAVHLFHNISQKRSKHRTSWFTIMKRVELLSINYAQPNNKLFGKTHFFAGQIENLRTENA